MWIDKLGTFADGVAPGNVGTNVIGDVVDLQVGGLDIGQGNPVYFVAMVEAALEAAAPGTLRIELVTADNAALTSNPEVVLTSTTVAPDVTPVAAGTLLLAASLPFRRDYRRFLGIRAVVGAANVTAGSISAFLTNEMSGWKANPSVTGF